MSTPEFSLDWQHGWQTRNQAFTDVRFIGKTRNGDLVFEYETGSVVVRTEAGTLANLPGHEAFDIINKPAPKREFWVNVYPVGNTHPTRDEADLHAQSKRIACVKITEGDGL